MAGSLTYMHHLHTNQARQAHLQREGTGVPSQVQHQDPQGELLTGGQGGSQAHEPHPHLHQVLLGELPHHLRLLHMAPTVPLIPQHHH